MLLTTSAKNIIKPSSVRKSNLLRFSNAARSRNYTTKVVTPMKVETPADFVTPLNYDIASFGLEGIQLNEEQLRLVNEFKEEFVTPQLEQLESIRTLSLLQKALYEFDYFQGIAKQLNKSIYDLTGLEVATKHLENREAFVKDLELDKTVLFSSKESLNDFKPSTARFLSLFTKTNPAPEWLVNLIKNKERDYEKRAENELVEELVVDEDVYQQVKERNFPSFTEKGITAEDLLAYNNGFITSLLPSANPKAKPFVDLLVKITDPKISEAEKDATFKELTNLLKEDHYDPTAYLAAKYIGRGENIDDRDVNTVHENVFARQKQKWVTSSISRKLGRPVKPGDFVPQKRLLADALEVHHPILQKDRTSYYYGDVSEVDLVSDPERPFVKFTPKDHFNPPSHARPISREELEEHPALLKELQVKALDFAFFEGDVVANPINAGEHIVQMKLWKLFKYLLPELDGNMEMRRHFIENYDLSPGEFTLEWTLSYPAPEHIFMEYPMWVQVYEIDEEEPPVMWPYYYVRKINTKAYRTIENIDTGEYKVNLLGSLAGTKAAAKIVADSWGTLNKEEKIELLQFISPYYSNKTITDEDLEDVTMAIEDFKAGKSGQLIFQERLKFIEEEMAKREEKEDRDMIDSLYTNKYEKPTPQYE